jgi:hypothetical protein
VVQRYKKPFKLIRHFGAWRVAEQNLFIKRLVHRLDHTQRLWVALTFLNKYVALSVCVRCRSLHKSQTSDELSLFLEGEHSYEEEGVEAMELTVDGKARANNGGIH